MRSGRSSLRWSLPVGIAGFAVAASVALPAISAGADPALPEVSAQQLLTRALSADVDAYSGTVRTQADLGIPALPERARSSDLSSLLTGDGTLRVAKSGEHRQRLSVLGSTSERSYIRDGRTAWMYDSGERKAVRTTLPDDSKRHDHERLSPDQAAKRILGELRAESEVSVGRAGEVADRAAYQLVVKPTAAESLIGSVQVPVDAKTWMPLGLTVLPRGSAEPAVDIRFSELSYATPAASTFEFQPPAGTEVERKSVEPRATRWHGDKGERAKRDHGRPSWTKVVQLGDAPAAKSNDEAVAYLEQLRAAGTRVNGDFGGGTLVRSRLVTLLILDDGRMLAGAVTPEAVQRAAAKA